MQELGWGVSALDHEDGNGQFEINFGLADAVRTADRFMLLRKIVADLAAVHGAIATFMPKPLSGRTGSGAHPLLLLDPGRVQRLRRADDPRGLGISATDDAFAGGIMAHARGLAALAMPTVNSYKRLWSGGGSSGATWSPAAIVLGANNRTAMLRVPGPGRFENRAVDGSCNPYLALAAGLDGVERGLDSGDPIAARPSSAADRRSPTPWPRRWTRSRTTRCCAPPSARRHSASSSPSSPRSGRSTWTPSLTGSGRPTCAGRDTELLRGWGSVPALRH